MSVDFISDGCTAGFLSNWFNSIVNGSIRQCCVKHDIAYFEQLGKWQADLDLVNCVSQTGLSVIGIAMGVVVFLFGKARYDKNKKNNNA